MDTRQTLEIQLKRLNQQVDEAEARLGAHSVKPILMQRLFALEEERDALLQKLNALAVVIDEVDRDDR